MPNEVGPKVEHGIQNENTFFVSFVQPESMPSNKVEDIIMSYFSDENLTGYIHSTLDYCGDKNIVRRISVTSNDINFRKNRELMHTIVDYIENQLFDSTVFVKIDRAVQKILRLIPLDTQVDIMKKLPTKGHPISNFINNSNKEINNIHDYSYHFLYHVFYNQLVDVFAVPNKHL